MKFYEQESWTNLSPEIKVIELKKRFNRVNKESAPKTKQKMLQLYMQAKEALKIVEESLTSQNL